jgi:hypothetical protein
MTSAVKTTANRRNALKSTGPRTPEGKAVASQNARKHGLLSREVLLPDEDETSLVEFGKRIRSQLQPIGELELFLVDRIVTAAWRLRRVLGVEVGIFGEEWTSSYSGENDGLGPAFIRATAEDSFSKLSRYEAGIERGLYKALHELQRLQAVRTGGNPPLP